MIRVVFSTGDIPSNYKINNSNQLSMRERLKKIHIIGETKSLDGQKRTEMDKSGHKLTEAEGNGQKPTEMDMCLMSPVTCHISPAANAS